MNYHYYLRIICEVSQFAVLIPLVFALFRFKYLTNLFRQIVLLVLILAAIGFTGAWFYWKGKNNIPLMHFYTLAEVLLWGMIYYSIFTQLLIKRILLGLLVSAVLVFVGSTGSLDLLYKVHYTNKFMESIVLLYCSVAWFYLALKNNDNLRQEDLFILNIGVFIYGINNGSFTVARTWLLEDSTAPLELWAIYDALLIVYYFLITVAMGRNTKVPITA